MELFEHRAWDPVGEVYVYWLSLTRWDTGGTDYVGPPAFGSLESIVMTRAIPASAEALMLLRIENTSPDVLALLEEI